jgi:ribonuclease-3
MSTSNIDLAVLSELIGATPKDEDLYITAFTHRSYLNEHRGFPLPHNERLEFLGDAILNAIIARCLFDLVDAHRL